MRPTQKWDVPRAMRLVLAYSLAHVALGAASLSAAAAAADAYGISRAVLQLASALSLLPSAAARRRRAPTVAALAAALALLVDAVLLTLAAVHQIVHGSGGLRSTPRYLTVAAAQGLLSMAAAASAAPRALPYLQGIERKRRAPPSAAPQQQPLSSGRRRRALEEASAVDLGMLLVLLHAVSCVAARGADIFAAFGHRGDIWPAFVDACAAFLSMNLLLAPTKMLCRILLQATPERLVSSLRARLDNVLAIDGVVDVAHAHFWEETPGVCIGAVALAVSVGVKSNVIVPSVRQIFGSSVAKLTIEVEEVSQNELSFSAHTSDAAQTNLNLPVN